MTSSPWSHTVHPHLLQVACKDGEGKLACDDRAPDVLATHPHLHEHEPLPVWRESGADGAGTPEGAERCGEVTEAERGATGALTRTQVSTGQARNTVAYPVFFGLPGNLPSLAMIFY